VATAEALLLGCQAGIDVGVLRSAFAGSAAASHFIQVFSAGLNRSYGL
jgi:3-hydroxyisobutyrate dehydrogenase-like beta-hydroxyacid dehydrogenase